MKFNEKEDIWPYFGDTYKVYVPKALITEFEDWAKKNKIDIKISATYNYSHRKNFVARDYIVHKDHKTLIKRWLKKSYKGI